jgi:hypothetical protein
MTDLKRSGNNPAAAMAADRLARGHFFTRK